MDASTSAGALPGFGCPGLAGPQGTAWPMSSSGTDAAAPGMPFAPGGADPGVGPAEAEPSSPVRLDELYRDQSRALVRHLTRKTGCREVALELTNEAFLRLLRMTPARFSSIAEPRAYLHRVSSNLLRDWGRGRALRDRSRASLESLAANSLDQVAILEARDTLRRLEQAMSRLKPKTREIFLAHRLEGLSYSEIAARTGLSLKGVEKQMSKAIAKIDRLLDRS